MQDTRNIFLQQTLVIFLIEYTGRTDEAQARCDGGVDRTGGLVQERQRCSMQTPQKIVADHTRTHRVVFDSVKVTNPFSK